MSRAIGQAVRAAALIGVSVLFADARAFAEPTAADKETARRLMAEGRTHRKNEDWKSAYQSFVAADAIMHVPTTGLEVARAEAQLGQLVEAREKLLEVIRLPLAPDEPRAFAEARVTAKMLSAEIESRIPSITIKLSGVTSDARVTVTVDGVEVPPAALNAPRAVDPGHHVVSARAAGGEARENAVDVQESEIKEVAIEVPPPSAGGPSDANTTTAGGSSPDRSSPWLTVTFVGLGVGAAGLIAGSVTGVLAISDFNSAKANGCVGNQCPPAAYSELDKAGTMATISTVGFIVGGVGVGAGVVGYFLSRKSRTASSSTMGLYLGEGVELDVGPGSALVRGRF